MSDIHAHGNDRTFLDDHTLDDLGARADEAVVLDDGRAGLYRFQHAADADTAGQVNVLADLCTGTHGCPGVDHGATVDIGADVDIGGHQDCAGCNIGSLAGRCRRYHAYTAFTKFTRVGVGVLRGHLVVVVGEATFYEGIVLDAERQQHGLFQPVVDDPVAVFLLGHAGHATVQHVDGLQCGLLDVGIDIARGDIGTALKGGFNC